MIETVMTKRINRVFLLAIASAVSLLVLSGTVYAVGEGQLEGGDIYRVRNVTKNTAFSDPATADKCETVQYKVRLHNPGPGVVSNVNVKATLPSAASMTHVSTVTVTAQNAQPASRSDTATLNLSTSQKIEYVSGSTELLNSTNGLIQALPDGILAGGINIGNVGVSLNETRFVQFKAKVNCPTPPQETPVYKCEDFNITADDKRVVKVSKFTTTATGGATFKNVAINWGDGSAVLTTTEAIGQTHTYSENGTYTITATARFTVNGQEVTDGGPECQQQVTFKEDKLPVVTPPTPTPPTVITTTPTTTTTTTPTEASPQLASTGAGSVAGLFTIATIVGALAHRRFLARRLIADADG